MFARKVHVHLKHDSAKEFTQWLEKDVLPLLRKQKGFQDEITFVGQGGKESIRNQFMGQGGECRGLQPRSLP
jgi:prophage antirepressor-like protein